MGRILVTGATGHVGGQLLPELISRGYRVRAMVRRAPVQYQACWPKAEIVLADALDRDSLGRAMTDVDTVYYLIHSLRAGRGRFEQIDIQAARNVRRAAAGSGVRRIIYLSGLGDTRSALSPHLRSRRQVADELRRGQVAVTVLRAATIIGPGSASYEILSHLVRSTPVIPLPSWARTKCQPIATSDVIKILVGVLELDATSGRAFDIGGPEVLTYETMLRRLARLLGKRRLFVRSPISNVPLNAYFVSRVTPVAPAICSSLMVSLRDPVVCESNEIEDCLPYPRLTYRQALLSALSTETCRA